MFVWRHTLIHHTVTNQALTQDDDDVRCLLSIFGCSAWNVTVNVYVLDIFFRTHWNLSSQSRNCQSMTLASYVHQSQLLPYTFINSLFTTGQAFQSILPRVDLAYIHFRQLNQFSFVKKYKHLFERNSQIACKILTQLPQSWRLHLPVPVAYPSFICKSKTVVCYYCVSSVTTCVVRSKVSSCCVLWHSPELSSFRLFHWVEFPEVKAVNSFISCYELWKICWGTVRVSLRTVHFIRGEKISWVTVTIWVTFYVHNDGKSPRVTVSVWIWAPQYQLHLRVGSLPSIIMSTSLTLSGDQQMNIFLIIKRGFNTDYMVQIFQKNHRITASVGSRISQTRAPIYWLAKVFPKTENETNWTK